MPNITQAEVNATVGVQGTEIGVKIGTTFWYVRYGGAAIKLSHLAKSEEVGSVKGGLGGVNQTTALVETINTNVDKQGKGLGKLLAAVFYAHWAANGATHVQLGTTDTSNGFWARLGVSQSAATPIGTAIANVYGIGGFLVVQAK